MKHNPSLAWIVLHFLDDVLSWFITKWRPLIIYFIVFPLSTFLEILYQFQQRFFNPWRSFAYEVRNIVINENDGTHEDQKQNTSKVKKRKQQQKANQAPTKTLNQEQIFTGITDNSKVLKIVQNDNGKYILRVSSDFPIPRITKILSKYNWRLLVSPENSSTILTLDYLLENQTQNQESSLQKLSNSSQLKPFNYASINCSLSGGVSSSSIHSGLFHETIEKVYISHLNSIFEASPSQNQELFQNIPWSCNTLGKVVALDLAITKTKPYIEMTYTPFHSKKMFIEHLFKVMSQNYSQEDYFLDAILFTSQSGVIMEGISVNEIYKKRYNPINRFYKPFFYKHVEKILKNGKIVTEVIPSSHYFQRYSRSFFWQLENIIPYCNFFPFRFLFGWMLPLKIPLLKLTESKYTKSFFRNEYANQNIIIPLNHLEELLNILDEVCIYPLWICPIRTSRTSNQGLVNLTSNEFYINVGIYGPLNENLDFQTIFQTINKFVLEKRGYLGIGSDFAQMSRDDFGKMFNHSIYNILRKEMSFDESSSNDLYDKLLKKYWQ